MPWNPLSLWPCYSQFNLQSCRNCGQAGVSYTPPCPALHWAANSPVSMRAPMLAPRLPEHAAGRVAAWLKASRMPHPPPDESEKRAATASQQRGAIGRAGARVYRHLPSLKTSAQPFCDFVGPPTNWILTAISCHRRALPSAHPPASPPARRHRRALPPAHPTASPPARRVERQRAACRRSSRCDVCHRAPVEQCCLRTDVHSMNKDQTHAPTTVHCQYMHRLRPIACTSNGPLPVHAGSTRATRVEGAHLLRKEIDGARGWEMRDAGP